MGQLGKLKRILSAMFGRFGQHDLKMPMDIQTSSGFCFVTFESKDQAMQACQHLNGMKLDIRHRFACFHMETYCGTALHEAILNGQRSIVERCLAEAGAGLAELLLTKDSMGATPLALSALCGRRAAPLLWPLLAATEREALGKPRDADAEQLLCASDCNQGTALHHLCFHGLAEAAEALCGLGERTGALDNMLSQWNDSDLTPTWLAAAHGHYEIVERIWARVEHRDSVFPPKLGPLMLVRRDGSTLLHRILGQNHTPLKSAAEERLRIIRVAKLTDFLRSVLAFADRAGITLMLLDAMNSERMTPLAIAQSRSAKDAAYEASCQVLQEAAARENASLARRVVAMILRAVASTG